MRLPTGPWDGAQSRAFVLGVLKRNGVEVNKLSGPDEYELVDLEGDPVVLTIPNPVLSEMIVYLWRRFGTLHGFLITDLTKKH